ncbi:hypothetical protein HETIRDRAFT_424449 [Heterobasidion irregulare TC 32-1]|uniref:Uncharacterized protein n=1 Tax=Heterobasidion irregulare (strain TC 32-1) TaxID=747525 RepID=W4KPM4_HETIT|nr:uncharacterized protein HETIRDRAFT_424449 [Heterobasidion irregulare TC 32-1]ETW87767.1 hypothetical protein HETIRDRAFT_424449 [Heterobasidion irregulare TC 32-1]
MKSATASGWRVGAFTVARKDTWQINALSGVRLGYMKGQLDMFNRVVERWGTTRLRPAAGWEAEEAAMAKHSWQELQAVLREALRRKVEAWRRLTHSGPDSQLAKPTHPDRMRLYMRRSLRLAEKRSKGL